MKKYKNGGYVKENVDNNTVPTLMCSDSILSREQCKKKDNQLACLPNKGETWICRMCGALIASPLAHSCGFEQNAPVLTGCAAKEFLKKVKENENKKVPKEDYERAKKNYKNFKVI